MASKQSKILNEILNQKKDEVKKLEEFVKEWKTKGMDFERQYQENHKVYFVFSLIIFLFLYLFFFQAKHTLFTLFTKHTLLYFTVLIQSHIISIN